MKFNSLIAILIFSLIILSCSANNDDQSDTHYFKGQVIYGQNKEPIPNFPIKIADYGHPLNFCIDEVDIEIETDSLGKFDQEYKAYCDVKIFIELSDSLKTIYDKCYYWKIIDKNDNTIDYFSSCGEIMRTERDKKYDFDIHLRPIIDIKLTKKNVEHLEFDSIAIASMNIYHSDHNSLPSNLQYDLYGQTKSGEIPFSIFYTDGTINDTFLNYNYLQECNLEFEIKI